MQIETWPISRVKPYEQNPRRIGKQAVEKVAKSIDEFGWQQPIVVDIEGVIVVGHTRLLAAKQLKLKKVPVHTAKGLSPEQIRAYRLADNRTGEESAWDLDLLSTEMQGLEEVGFDLDLTGFDGNELASLTAQAGLTDPDDTPEPPETPVTALGDIWICGEHRLRCGDSTNAENVAELLAGTVPLLMVTDPPYGVNYDAAWRNLVDPANGKPYGGRAVGKVKNDDCSDWREAWVLFPGEVAYVWHSGIHAAIVQASLEAEKFQIRAQIIWAKSKFVIGRGHYHVRHEPCWYAVRNKGHWQGSRTESTLWQIDHRKSDTGHSTQKPVECMRRPIMNNSEFGGAVYDPFLGSGTTMIAAEMEGRRCYGMEIEPGYCDVIVKRWENFTGKSARLEGNGGTHEEIIEARA